MRLLAMLLATVIVVLLVAAAALFYGLQPLLSKAMKPNPVFVDPARLEFHVKTLSQKFAPRDYSHSANLDKVARYIRDEFAQTGGRIGEQPYQVGGQTFRNVTAAFGPLTKKRVIVGAHYDAAGSGPGADDNASGIAGLLELAHLLARSELSGTVELVAYALEEPPFFASAAMGSAVHVRSLQTEGAEVRAMVALEMIGYFRDEENSQRFPLKGLSYLYPNQGNFIAVVGKIGQGALVRKVKRGMAAGSPLPVCSITAPRSLPGIDLSDHWSYWQAGHPAVMVTDTAFFRNPHYHTSADTAETLDYRRMAQVVAGVYAAVVELSK